MSTNFTSRDKSELLSARARFMSPLLPYSKQETDAVKQRHFQCRLWPAPEGFFARIRREAGGVREIYARAPQSTRSVYFGVASRT